MTHAKEPRRRVGEPNVARALAGRQWYQPRFSFAPLLLFLGAVLLGGCQQRIEPPRNLSDPVGVFVIDYGRHASLALSTEEAGLVEWSWGDWNWFALGRTGVLDGLRALFASPQSTLSRRALGTGDNAENLLRQVGARDILRLEVEHVRDARLLDELEARWQARADEAVRHADGRVMVPDEARYSLFDNSVHELARWLEALGANVSGGGDTANFRIQETQEN